MINQTDEVIANMVEVHLDSDDAFRKVKETLTRMGVSSRHEKTLYQSVHILHKRGHYYLCHFKELFRLDGREANITDGDLARRNRIAQMLQDWGLIEIDESCDLEPMGKPSLVKVIKYADANDWNLEQKYAIGNKKRQTHEEVEH